MKKIIKLLLVFFIVFSTSGCSNEKENKPLKMELKKENKFDDLVSYKIESIGKPKQITPDLIGITYSYYKPQKETNVLLDIVINMKNLTKSELNIEKKLEGIFIIGEDTYAASLASLNDDGTALKQGAVIASDANAKIHFYIEVSPKKLDKEIEFKLTTMDKENPHEANLKFKLNKVNKDYEVKNINDVITFDNQSEITLQATSITKELVPTNPKGLYTYYKVSSDTNSFVVLTTSIKNISANEMLASDATIAKLIGEDGNEYPVNIFSENDSQDSLVSGKEKTILVNQSALVHFVFEIPNDIINTKKMVRFSFQGNVYMVNL